MKYFLILSLSFLCFFGVTQTSHAQTATPKAEPTQAEESEDESTLSDQINDLKDKIASRVASLKLVDKRGIIGTVTEVKDTQITITDPQQKKRIIDIDEITKFSSPSAKSTFGISDINVGSEVSVIGLYNKQSRRILGRFVETITKPIFITGVISEKNEKEFTISVLTNNDMTTTIDIERLTKTNTYSDEDEIVKAGFTQLEVGDRVVVTGYPVEEKNRLTGIRILRLPEAPKHPDIIFDYPEESATPSSTLKKSPTSAR